ncbi:uncharacterized protein N7458_002759 [Penicillium daleae]|uniref:Glutathione S-transferase n=1 Tax=Penicillium daleae TaxID=63821 RepID=A0AAD6CFS5_9EURO|nr:uncharacterized protein N7458_002759 [Penicillium daleae]KAJ5461207.1 hypothetical protein N7458_002759 [Penicillium daleae]
MAKYRIYNRRQQGLAETARLILEISGAEYENVYPKDWDKEKGSTPLGQLPVLHVQETTGDWVSIAESHTVERFLAADLGLLGSNPIEAAVLDMYHAAWCDMIAMFMWKVWRVNDEDSKKRGAAEFWDSFPKFLDTHENILASRGPFYGGEKASLPDIYAFTWLNRFISKWVPSPPGSLTEEKYPRLWALWRSIRENDRIKSYIESGRWQLKE